MPLRSLYAACKYLKKQKEATDSAAYMNQYRDKFLKKQEKFLEGILQICSRQFSIPAEILLLITYITDQWLIACVFSSM
jgi:hypothetical protein